MFMGVNLIGRWFRKEAEPRSEAQGGHPPAEDHPGHRLDRIPHRPAAPPVSPSGAPSEGDHLPLPVCGIVLTLAAALLILIHVNRYVAIRFDEMVMRTLSRRIKRIAYSDIASYGAPTGRGPN